MLLELPKTTRESLLKKNIALCETSLQKLNQMLTEPTIDGLHVLMFPNGQCIASLVNPHVILGVTEAVQFDRTSLTQAAHFLSRKDKNGRNPTIVSLREAISIGIQKESLALALFRDTEQSEKFKLF